MKKMFALIAAFIALLYTACGSDTSHGTSPDADFSGNSETTGVSVPSEAGGESFAPSGEPSADISAPVLHEKQDVYLDSAWEYAGNSVINTGCAVLYRAQNARRGITVAVNAGHGTAGGAGKKTLCHPDGTPKLAGGTTAAGSVYAVAVSAGTTFFDGTPESSVTLRMAQILKEYLLAEGYDVLMLRDDADVQLDNVARTVIANNTADCHISLHWDGDGLNYDKGCFCILPLEKLRTMSPVDKVWREHDLLGEALVDSLRDAGAKINGSGKMLSDLTQIAYSTIPSVDMELGNAVSVHDDAALDALAQGLVAGINGYFSAR